MPHRVIVDIIFYLPVALLVWYPWPWAVISHPKNRCMFPSMRVATTFPTSPTHVEPFFPSDCRLNLSQLYLPHFWYNFLVRSGASFFCLIFIFCSCSSSQIFYSPPISITTRRNDNNVSSKTLLGLSIICCSGVRETFTVAVWGGFGGGINGIACGCIVCSTPLCHLMQ